MNSTTIAVDVAKAVFEVAVSEHPGQIRERHRFSRERFRRYLGEQPPAVLLMEACGSAHYWGRQAQTHGHRVVLLPPHVVRPYVLGNKTDRTDAKGLLEAARNDAARPVPVKTETQQAVVALHRLRSTWLATRTARLNTVRGLLREFGIVIPTGARHVGPTLGALLEDVDTGLPTCSGRPWPKRAGKFGSSRAGSESSSANSTPSPTRCPSSTGCARSPGSGS